MPHNKAQKIKNQQNKSSIMEAADELQPKKQAGKPSSLNKIPKQES
ncbi:MULTISPECIES: hypothetical protein [Paenibacillus]|nr:MULTISPECIES: hypothetical protein [Paenibacillus]